MYHCRVEFLQLCCLNRKFQAKTRFLTRVLLNIIFILWLEKFKSSHFGVLMEERKPQDKKSLNCLCSFDLYEKTVAIKSSSEHFFVCFVVFFIVAHLCSFGLTSASNDFIQDSVRQVYQGVLILRKDETLSTTA